MTSKVKRHMILVFRAARDTRDAIKDALRVITVLVFLLLSTLFTVDTLAADKKRAERAVREGDFEQAESLYRELLKKEKNSKDAMLGLSLALLKQRKLQESFDVALYVKKLDPDSARACALAGTALLAVGDFKTASSELNQALTLKPGEAMAIAGIAMIDFYENRLESSIKGLRRAIELDSREPDYIFSLAQAASRTERYKEAADAYERFLVVAPRTDADRRARIRGLIDFLHFLNRQNTKLYLIGGATNILVPINAQSSRPIIKVRVNDSKEEYRFVIDTGSGMTVISDKTAALLGLRPVAHGGMARAIGGVGKFEIVYGFLQSLQIAGIRLENVPVYIRRFFNTTESIDGYIGLSVLSKFLVSIDYKSSTISLSRSTGDRPSATETFIERTKAATESAPVLEPDQIAGEESDEYVNMDIPLRSTASGFLSGEVNLKGVDQPLNFIVDTGASVSVVSSTLASRVELSRYSQNLLMKVYGAAGVAENVPTLRLPSVRFGPNEHSDLMMVVLDLNSINETTGFEQQGIVGGNFLKNYRLFFDFQKSIMRLESLAGALKKIVPVPALKPKT